MGGSGGGVRWNDETQSWETVGAGQGAGAYPQPPVTQPPVAPPPVMQPPVVPPQGPPPVGPPSAPVYDPYPPNGYPTAPVPTGPDPVPRGIRRTRLIALCVAAALVGGGAAAAWVTWGGDGGGKPDAKSGASVSASASSTESQAVDSVSESPTPSSTETATDSPSPTASGELPVGYTLQHDTKGFTIAVPTGWTRSERTNGVFYATSGDGSLMQIYSITEPDTTPRQSMEATSAGLAKEKTNYQEISLEDVPGEDAAQLVYAYDKDGTGERRQVADRAFTGTDGRQYAVLVAGPATDWPQQEEHLKVALDSFVAGR
ncbi:hypothetical protein [Streptomyces sp. NBC_01465]|uniref:hypothetical protein n=1 Tax=Streptomyces sp. NBC_01465 TaxID=2903878 RepID=UPI002E307CDE|nr:hypothetical protein [Streptomyces sp. NBC_01465]